MICSTSNCFSGETVLIIDSLLGNEAQKQANQEFLSKGIEDTESGKEAGVLSK